MIERRNMLYIKLQALLPARIAYKLTVIIIKWKGIETMKFEHETTITLSEAVEAGYMESKVFETEEVEEVLNMISTGICKADESGDYRMGDLLFEAIRNIRDAFGLDDWIKQYHGGLNPPFFYSMY